MIFCVGDECFVLSVGKVGLFRLRMATKRCGMFHDGARAYLIHHSTIEAVRPVAFLGIEVGLSPLLRAQRRKIQQVEIQVTTISFCDALFHISNSE
jgi:hypothetical protein